MKGRKQRVASQAGVALDSPLQFDPGHIEQAQLLQRLNLGQALGGLTALAGEGCLGVCFDQGPGPVFPGVETFKGQFILVEPGSQGPEQPRPFQ